ncbi:MAG: GGDEF domain-containing protein [Deltaproteobacteria bacterium]|nr:MAG: GGDEF domain-containing protein [Deltaproteobacteria bacterium]
MDDSSEAKKKTVVTVISKITERPVAQAACLVVIYGLDLGRKYNLEKPSLIIGRSSKADIQVDQESVSRSHAKLVNSGKAVIIRDLGSTNGTYVNDDLIEESQLRDGDLIKIGRTIFKFLSGSNIENSYHEEIYRLTTVDGLTNVYNKRYFMENLEREMSRASRYDRQLSLLIFDIDHFKQINDTYGHLAGDHVLKRLAAVVMENIRREDFLARYGGEEFAIILPEIDRPNAVVMAEKIRRLVEASDFSFEGTEISLTISVGVATIEDQASDAVDLIRQADGNLYQAKRSGRNKVVG